MTRCTAVASMLWLSAGSLMGHTESLREASLPHICFLRHKTRSHRHSPSVGSRKRGDFGENEVARPWRKRRTPD